MASATDFEMDFNIDKFYEVDIIQVWITKGIQETTKAV